MLTIIWGYILPLIGLVLVLAAGACFIYVPIFGRWIAAGLLVIAAALFAFGVGYQERGALDQSATLRKDIAQLQANNAELQRQADEAKNVAADAAAAEKVAEDQATANQQKVDAYVAQLQSSPGCGLTDADVERLRAIGGTRTSP